MPSDFDGAFARLRQILVKHGPGMTVLADKPGDYALATKATAPNGKPMWFGAAMAKKSAVTFHVVPLYYNETLKATLSPELLKRMQGKTCFNFQRPDEALFAELDALVARGREQWRRLGFLDPGVIDQAKIDAMLKAGGHDPKAVAREREAKGNAAAAKRAATLKKKAPAKKAAKKSAKKAAKKAPRR